MSKHNSPKSSGARSVPRHSDATQQILFPEIRLDLAVVVLLLICLWLVVHIVAPGHLQSVAALGAGSTLSACWLVLRIRRALARVAAGEGRHGA